MPESRAQDREGQAICGPIVQHAICDKKPVEGQEVPLRYQVDEPIFFELLGPIQYEN